MSEAGIPTPVKSVLIDSSSQLSSLIEDAEYLCLELARGDAVSAEVLGKSKSLIQPLMNALLDAKASDPPSDAQYCALEAAMVDMIAAIAPVTINSLRDTENAAGMRGIIPLRRVKAMGGETGGGLVDNDALPPPKTRSNADKFSDRFFRLTIGFLLAALACSALASPDVCAAFCAETDGQFAKFLCETGKVLLPTTNTLLPALFGGLGACVYLLRSLHKHIYERTFDVRYQPEYWNRIILGVVSGAIVTLLAKQLQGNNALGSIGPAAMAFLVGYNTDLLFSLIERVSIAFFPKVSEPPAANTTPGTPPKDPPDKTVAAQVAAALAAGKAQQTEGGKAGG